MSESNQPETPVEQGSHVEAPPKFYNNQRTRGYRGQGKNFHNTSNRSSDNMQQRQDYSSNRGGNKNWQQNDNGRQGQGDRGRTRGYRGGGFKNTPRNNYNSHNNDRSQYNSNSRSSGEHNPWHRNVNRHTTDTGAEDRNNYQQPTEAMNYASMAKSPGYSSAAATPNNYHNESSPTDHSSSRQVDLNPAASAFTPASCGNDFNSFNSSNIDYPDESGGTLNFTSDCSLSELDITQPATDKKNASERNDTNITNDDLAHDQSSFLDSSTATDSSFDAWNATTVSPNTSGKLQGGNYKQTKNAAKQFQRDIHTNENSSLKSTSFEKFEKKFHSSKPITDFKIVEEKEADLFAMDPSFALANCVAVDLNMGSGIAVSFRQNFKKVDELMAQRQNVGGLAYLIHEGRYVYYLITKKESSKKPTYETMYRSLEKLQQNMVENNVKKLAIPRLGCGLDRLEWHKVKAMLEFVFAGTDIKITVCNFQKADETMSKRKEDLQHRKCPVYNVATSITQVSVNSIVLYLGTVNGHTDKIFDELNDKFRILTDYKNSPRTLGTMVTTNVQNFKYYLVGCIVKQKYSDVLDYKAFETCIKDINRENNKWRKTGEHYSQIAINTYYDNDNDQMMSHLVNLLKNTLFGFTITVHGARN